MCWEQIDNYNDELSIWLNSVIHSMEDMNANFTGIGACFLSLAFSDQTTQSEHFLCWPKLAASKVSSSQAQERSSQKFQVFTNLASRVSDAASAQNLLDKYEGELPHHEEVFDTMGGKITQLEDLNQHRQIPQLKDTQQVWNNVA